MKLVVVKAEAKVVKFIYAVFLRDVPLYKMKEKAHEPGFPKTGNIAIERILTNPFYAGMLSGII